MADLSRGMKQYLEIENFKDFEFTNCIAYEMFIRVPRVQELLAYVLTEPTDELLRELSEYGFVYEDYLMFTLERVHSPYRTKRPYIDTTPWQGTLNDILSEAQTERIIQLETEAWNESIEDAKTRDEVRQFCMYLEYPFTDESLTIIKNNMRNVVNAKDYFSRPKLKFRESKIINMEINVALPLSELKAYIEELHRCRNEYPSPMEYFALDILERKEKIKNPLSKQERIATMFFIYDCDKLGYKHRKISNLYYNYYADKGIETKTLDYDTYKKYLKFAKEFIDNLKYKELLNSTLIS